MSRILPLRSEVRLDDEREPNILDIGHEDADTVFSALSSTTARKVLTTLHEEPQTASDLARALDTTLQNIQYHVGNLSDTDLIEVVDTWYSEQGKEMKVYSPSDSPMVLFAGPSSVERLRDTLVGLLGIGLLLGLSVLASRTLAERLFLPSEGSDQLPPVSGDTLPGNGETSVLEELPLLLDPAVVFVLGGLTALVLVGLWWSYRRFTFTEPSVLK